MITDPLDRSPEEEEKRWLLRSRTIRQLWFVSSGALFLLVLVGMLIHPHSLFGIDGTFGFHAWYCFFSCVAMVLFAKVLGVVLKRPDTFYDD